MCAVTVRARTNWALSHTDGLTNRQREHGAQRGARHPERRDRTFFDGVDEYGADGRANRHGEERFTEAGKNAAGAFVTFGQKAHALWTRGHYVSEW